jgi:hypothetical protein
MRISVPICLALTLAPEISCMPQQANADTATYVSRSLLWLKNKEPMPWQDIPWVSSLLEGRRLSEKEGYPMFVYLYKGKLDTGRC